MSLLRGCLARFPSRPITALLLAALLLCAPAPARAEVYLQFFETPWSEIKDRLPEVMMHGYSVLWLPPPSKGCEGAADPGYAVFDRFDLGDKNQRGSTATRYGTRDELVALTKELHKLGGKVVFDIIMNHNGNPARIENAHVTLKPATIDSFPQTRPLDYQLLPGRTYDNGYSYQVKLPSALGGGTAWVKPQTGCPQNQSCAYDWPEKFVAAVPIPSGYSIPGYTHLVRAPWINDWNSTFQIENYSLLGLIDFAAYQHLNAAGTGEDASKNNINNLNGLPLARFVRQPGCTSCYPGGKPVAEDIRQFLHRWMWWMGKITDADGYRLDAIKHVPPSFFNYDFNGDTIAFNKKIQDDYDTRRGYTDANDDDDKQDAIIFGESYTGIDKADELKKYRTTGMKVLNFPLMFKMLDIFGSGKSGSGDIGQLSYPHGGFAGKWIEFGGIGRHDGVNFAQSHDQQPADLQEDLAFAYVLTRPGPAVVFFDGNNYDTKSWVAPGRPDSLGDIGSTISTLVSIHNHYARGGMFNRFVDDDAYVYERVVQGKGSVLLMVLHDNIGSDARTDGSGVAKFGGYDPRPLVITGFPPGTKLTDLTGNSPVKTTTVLAPGSVSSAQLSAAKAKYSAATAGAALPSPYGLVHLAVPSGPSKNYAAYAVAPPQGPSNGARAVELWQAGQRVADTQLQTVGVRRTYGGVRVPAKVLTVPKVTGQKITVKLRVDATADAAYLAINSGGVALAGKSPQKNTDEGLWDGYVPLTRGSDVSGDRTFSLADLDISGLKDGNHILRVKAVNTQSNLPPVLETFAVPFVIDRTVTPPTIPTPDDLDGDGVKNATDNCPKQANPAQADFDRDGVGDLCDLCPLTHPDDTKQVDADGCRKVDPKQLSRVDEIVAVIKGEKQPKPALDLNGDGQVNMLDLVREVDRVHGNTCN